MDQLECTRAWDARCIFPVIPLQSACVAPPEWPNPWVDGCSSQFPRDSPFCRSSVETNSRCWSGSCRQRRPSRPLARSGRLSGPARVAAPGLTRKRGNLFGFGSRFAGAPRQKNLAANIILNQIHQISNLGSASMGGVGLGLWLLWIPRTVIGWESESLPNGSLVETAFSKHGRQGGEDPPTWGWELPKPFPDKPPPPAPPDSFLQKLGRNPTDSFFERFVTHQGPLSALWGHPDVHWPRNFIPADNEVPFDGSTLQ